ncbi:sensor histidine kinase [Cohnella sp. WQ 127256]|uniref:sensor histidine kinase n=1 Tax=Cohnella sp. WQ 127256 TaxID=2938790 RepID=UPI0021193409|nr:histidine kinase [Cohnella sp. WQ 127256]
MRLFLRSLEKLFYSIKKRLVVILLLSTILPLITLGFVSYISFSKLYQNKINNGIQNSLRQEGMALQSALDNLSYASVQLSYEGSIGQKFYQYLTESKQSQKIELREEISNNLTLVNFTNPNVGVMFYYFPNSQSILFENLEVTPGFDFSNLPVFTTYKNLTFNGPHRTSYRYGKEFVFSMLRQVDVAGFDTVFVYLETNFKLFQTVLNKKQFGMNAFHLLLNDKGIVVYSDDPEKFAIGKTYTETTVNQQYSYFIETDNPQGWKLAVAIPNSDIKQEMNKWLEQLLIIGSLAVVLSLWLGYAIFKMIYTPITQINKEVRLLSDPLVAHRKTSTNIEEFDMLMSRFSDMRQQVKDLIEEVKQKERLRGDLEVEKLLHQINPHFLYNTLNTIQWIARLNGEEEIDRLIAIFSNVLQYNLGKEGSLVTVGDEIEIIRDYITLQRIRYNYKFDVRVQVDESVKQVQIPRFILQPLVENALYHGMKDDCIIEVIVGLNAQNKLGIVVKDNGKGMKPEVLDRLFTGETDPRKKSGMGIGLNYVLRVLKTRYGERLTMDIQSEPEIGTSVSITIPLHID